MSERKEGNALFVHNYFDTFASLNKKDPLSETEESSLVFMTDTLIYLGNFYCYKCQFIKEYGYIIIFIGLFHLISYISIVYDSILIQRLQSYDTSNFSVQSDAVLQIFLDLLLLLL